MIATMGGTIMKEQKERTRKNRKPSYDAEKNALDVWASYKLSQREKSNAPTFDAIFKVTETYVHIWHRKTTGQIMIQPDKPEGKQWELLDIRRLALPNTTSNMLSATGIVAMAVDVALRTNLSKEDYQLAMLQLFWLYPRSGIYEANPPDVLARYHTKKQFDSLNLRVLRLLKHNRITLERLR